MIDLNVFVPEGGSLQVLTDALNINDRGEIMGVGFPPGVPTDDIDVGGHVFLLIPCHDESDSCRDAGTGRIAVTDAGAARTIRHGPDSGESRVPNPVERIRNWLHGRNPRNR
jgi:hypothetical protein